MSFDRRVIVTRSIYVSVCEKCGDRVERTEGGTKSRYHCDEWWDYVIQTYTGPDVFGEKKDE